MSGLERARKLYESGKYRKAVDAMWEIPLRDDSPPETAEALLELATALRGVTQGRLQQDCEENVKRAEVFLATPAAAPFTLPMPEPRDCPLCGGGMVPGSYSLEDTLVRSLVVGLSWQSLCFRPGVPESEMPSRQLLFDGMRRGWLCRACGASLIIKPEPRGAGA